jgi:hypothetical protein
MGMITDPRVEPSGDGGPMRDADIRAQLRADLAARFAHDPRTLILDELALVAAGARVDVAVVNGSFHAYEIKSAHDTLARLPLQADAYSAIFDAVTIVAAERHVERVAELVPAWWEIAVPVSRGSVIVLVGIRDGSSNPDQDPHAIAQLLWRDEALDALSARGLDRGLRTKPRRELWRALAEAVPIDDLGELVRNQLRARPAWRADLQPSSDGASSPRAATS